MSKQTIKIASVTDDGITISQHFGRARYYEVITIENGIVISSERRSKTGHHTFAGNESQHNHEQNEGMAMIQMLKTSIKVWQKVSKIAKCFWQEVWGKVLI